MAGFATASIYLFAKSSDKWERFSYALFAIAFLLFASGSFTLENTSWSFIGIVLAIAAIIIRNRADARRNRH